MGGKSCNTKSDKNIVLPRPTNGIVCPNHSPPSQDVINIFSKVWLDTRESNVLKGSVYSKGSGYSYWSVTWFSKIEVTDQ